MKMNRKLVGSVVIFAVIIVITFSSCNFLKSLLPNYVTINLDNGVLLSESENNEQICKYRIDASISNNYNVKIDNLEIKLIVPNNVTITNEGAESNIKESFEINESKNYSWIVKTPKTTVDQNVEYSVTADSKETERVESFATIFVKGINKNDNRLNFTTDTWKFKNFSTPFSIPLTQADYDALLVGLDNASIAAFKEKIGQGQGGYCYGFASSSILTKMGLLDVSDIDSSKTVLHDVDDNDNSKSVIAYYYLTQFFSNIIQDKVEFIEKNDTEKINIIEQKAMQVESGDSPFILSFYTKPNSEGGHAVVAYSHESGVFIKNNHTYDSRILIYDSNYPTWNEDSCLYYNTGTTEWYIPNYPDSSQITRALSDLNTINTKNLEDNRKSASSYISCKGNEQITIYEGDSLLAKVNGTIVTENDNVVAFRDDGNDDYVTIVVPYKDSNNDLIIKPTNSDESLDLSIKYNDYFISASSTSQDSIAFSSNGSAKISGDTDDFRLSITGNEGHFSTKWCTCDVSGKKGTDPQIQLVKDGYLITGKELNNLEVYAENKDSAQKVELSSIDGDVLITQDKESLCAKADNDNDGKYESIIKTGTETPVRNPLSNGENFNWWIIIIIAIIIILGVGVFILIKYLFSIRKPKQSNNDEWWMQ